MRIQDVLKCFKAEVEGEGLLPAHLDPWKTWKLFKRFTQHDLEGAYETAAFQFARFDDEPDDPYIAVFYVWQFTERDWSVGQDGEDELLGRLVVEFHYLPQARLLLPETELWGMDFPTPSEWAAVVEGLPQFQEAICHEPTATQVFYDQED